MFATGLGLVLRTPFENNRDQRIKDACRGGIIMGYYAMPLALGIYLVESLTKPSNQLGKECPLPSISNLSSLSSEDQEKVERAVQVASQKLHPVSVNSTEVICTTHSDTVCTTPWKMSSAGEEAVCKACTTLQPSETAMNAPNTHFMILKNPESSAVFNCEKSEAGNWTCEGRCSIPRQVPEEASAKNVCGD
jgi:hypothetical protein